MTRDHVILQALTRRGLELLVLLLSISTLLFFLLRLSGDPAAVLAGEEADAETVALISARYGFNEPLFIQYLRYLMLDLLQYLGAYTTHDFCVPEYTRN